MMRRILLPAILLIFAPALARAESGRPVDVREWKVIESESGPVNYYSVVDDPGRPFIHAEYRPGLKTTVIGIKASGARRNARKLRWSWRAVTLPLGGGACFSGRSDAAASVYVTWKRGLKWYVLKYVWTEGVPAGTACRKKGNPFAAQATIVLRAGGPLGEWRSEEIDLDAEFRKHFAGGNPEADVPDFKGLGLMTDGDQTKSVSAADYAGFVFVR